MPTKIHNMDTRWICHPRAYYARPNLRYRDVGIGRKTSRRIPRLFAL